MSHNINFRENQDRMSGKKGRWGFLDELERLPTLFFQCLYVITNFGKYCIVNEIRNLDLFCQGKTETGQGNNNENN